MNEGIKILLERMKTNPEEFIAEAQYGVTKWGTLIQEYRLYLDKEDLEVFDAAHKAVVFEHMKERFTEAVMRELLDPHKDAQGELGLGYKEHEHKVAHQIAMLKALQDTKTQLLPSSNEPLVNKKQITKFGRLYNHERNHD